MGQFDKEIEESVDAVKRGMEPISPAEMPQPKVDDAQAQLDMMVEEQFAKFPPPEGFSDSQIEAYKWGLWRGDPEYGPQSAVGKMGGPSAEEQGGLVEAYKMGLKNALDPATMPTIPYSVWGKDEEGNDILYAD